MFGDVWDWAGVYRLSDRNIGIDWTEVPAAVRIDPNDLEPLVGFMWS